MTYELHVAMLLLLLSEAEVPAGDERDAHARRVERGAQAREELSTAR